MSDVARVAGVSQSTVSHVINGSRPVAPATAEAVQRAIEETGFVHDDLARSLRRGHTSTVALAVSAISNPYFAEAVHAVEQHARSRGYAMMLVDTHDDPEEERRAVAQLLSRRPDGLIVAPTEGAEYSIDLARRRGVPTVLIDRVPGNIAELGIDAVGVEGRRATAQLARHVIGVGHTRIAMVAPKAGVVTTRDRLDGFRDALDGAGLWTDAAIVPGDEPGLELRLRALVTGPDPVTALVTGNNQLTIATMRALANLGLRVPEHLSLAGFDDFEWSDFFEPRLTAIHQPVGALGKRAAQLLIDRLEGYDGPPRVEMLEPELVVRSSVAPR